MKILSLCATATILSLAVLNAAHATDAAPKSRTVQFADLDLNKAEGVATLFNRIKGAAQVVCGSHLGRVTLRDQERHAACMRFAVSNAVARVDQPMLTEYVANLSVSGRQVTSKIASGR
jgi:UrcA family protein